MGSFLSALPALASTGASLFSAFSGGGSNRDPYAELYGANALNNIRGEIDSTFARASSLAEQKGQAGIQGAREARRSVDQIGSSSRQDILARGEQTGAAVTQDMARRGLANTTATAGAQRAVASDTSRNLTALDSALADLYADLDLAEGQAEAQMFGDLADVELGRNSALAGQYWNPWLQLWSGIGGSAGYGVASLGEPLDFSGLQTGLEGILEGLDLADFGG